MLSGCLSPADDPPDARQASNQTPGDNASSTNLSGPLPGPWNRGQEFHYRGENGIWQNWTVLGVEEKHNYTTYKVQINWSEPDDSGESSYTLWIDIDSLGWVAQDQQQVYFWSTQPLNQILPIGAKEYTSTWYARPSGLVGEFRVRVELGEHRQVRMPAGTFESQEIIYHVDGDGMDPERQTMWYSAEVGYYVSFVDSHGDFGPTRFNLTAWSP